MLLQGLNVLERSGVENHVGMAGPHHITEALGIPDVRQEDRFRIQSRRQPQWRVVAGAVGGGVQRYLLGEGVVGLL